MIQVLLTVGTLFLIGVVIERSLPTRRWSRQILRDVDLCEKVAPSDAQRALSADVDLQLKRLLAYNRSNHGLRLWARLAGLISFVAWFVTLLFWLSLPTHPADSLWSVVVAIPVFMWLPGIPTLVLAVWICCGDTYADTP